ncbi:MAG: hypothetical protein KBC35_01250 [Candidatus Pacebacteria bacterium]|nr:hypothetical protein [Candidatus Paceibacterota bacterium]
MANDGSLADMNPQFAFDLETQKGMMALLAAVRASGLTPAQKNEMRDLAFLYTNGGKDQSVRITLQQKVLGHGIQPLAPVVPEVVVAPPPVHPFGASRPAPSFSVTANPVPVVQPVTSAAPSVAVPQPVVTVAPVVPPSVPEPVPQTQVTQTPTPIAVEPTPIPQPVVIPEPTPMPVPEPVPVQPVAASVAAPAADSAPVLYDQTAAMQRIREIKALVNEKVGNPVNLVDIDNAVGREYMAALLDAMKKLSSGTAISSAMKRLEESFVAVEKTLEAHQNGTPIAVNVPPQEVVTDVPPQPAAPIVEPSAFEPSPQPVVPAAPVIPPVVPPPVPEPVPVFQSVPEPIVAEVPVVPLSVPEPVPTFEPVTPPVVEPVASPVLEELPEVESPVHRIVPIPSPKPKIVPPPAPQPVPLPRSYGTVPVQDPDYVVSVRENIIVDDSQHVTAVTPPEAASAFREAQPVQPQANKIQSAWGAATDHLPEKGRVVSVAEVKQKLRTPQDLPTAAEVATGTAGETGDHLTTKEVDDGLQQLLAEWSIFKKSGLFGTGPKGREHPLFKKIAGLQIPLLLAGRFEGATQEIKQSITDYMNGWRYEQGIIYEQGENFEHYLRRVIRHILDLQKR